MNVKRVRRQYMYSDGKEDKKSKILKNKSKDRDSNFQVMFPLQPKELLREE